MVDAAHERGLAVALDVVYNHLGPEGNYLGVYGPYFTQRYKTPWGEAINFDGPDSDACSSLFYRQRACIGWSPSTSTRFAWMRFTEFSTSARTIFSRSCKRKSRRFPGASAGKSTSSRKAI